MQVSYLRDAIEAVLAGRSPEIEETPAVGGPIKWRDQGALGGCA